MTDRCTTCGQVLPVQPPPIRERLRRYWAVTKRQLTDQEAWEEWMREHHAPPEPTQPKQGTTGIDSSARETLLLLADFDEQIEDRLMGDRR